MSFNLFKNLKEINLRNAQKKSQSEAKEVSDYVAILTRIIFIMSITFFLIKKVLFFKFENKFDLFNYTIVSLVFLLFLIVIIYKFTLLTIIITMNWLSNFFNKKFNYYVSILIVVIFIYFFLVISIFIANFSINSSTTKELMGIFN